MTSQSNNYSKEEKSADKRLYEIGDTTPTGAKIFGIYTSSVNFILYWGACGGLGWQIDNISPVTNNVISEARRLGTQADSILTSHRMFTVNRMLADIISTSIYTEDFKFSDNLFNEVKDFIEQYRDELKAIVSSGPLYNVYRLKDDLIQWNHCNLPETLRKPVEDFNALQSLASAVLPKSQRKSVSRLLSASLSSAFRCEKIADDLDLFEKPRKFIHSQIESYLKIKIFYISLFTTICMQFSLLCGYLYFNSGLMYFAGASAGIFGVMVSSLQRNNKITIDPYTSSLGLYSEGISRIFVGIIFGLFIIFCANSELALAPFKENIYALICFAFISGFSERFVPDLMSSVAGKANSNS
ncbi:hypothetical protein [Pseudoalteromonas arctica]|uniref:hypothetical protein n=1 Tax=Pseudoalteromonas arctica TaxID=394751 RepID=UPI00249408D8|nr:hypothetical protein [Pseudoalteromonas arctica]